jgi:Skp family chaperone for outer membrane proteins
MSMKNIKAFMLFMIIIILCVIFIRFDTLFAISKSETALVDLNKIYWGYKRTKEEQKELIELKRDMMQNLSPLTTELKRIRGLIGSQNYSKKIKYEYMKNYFLLSSKIQKYVAQYNKELMSLENEIRETLIQDIWNSVKTYTSLKNYKYVFRIGRQDIVAYDSSLDISNKVLSFIYTIPNAAELEPRGKALVIKSRTRLVTGKGSSYISAGRMVTILYDPQHILDVKSNNKSFIHNNREYNITVMYDGEIGLIPAESVTTNMKSIEVNLELGKNYKTYIGFENYIKSENIKDSNDYKLTVIKIPRLYLERVNDNDSFKNLDINKTNLEEVRISEIRDIDGDGIIDIVIIYRRGDNTLMKIIHIVLDNAGTPSERVDVYQASPYQDFTISTNQTPRTTNMKGESLRTELIGDRYYSLEEDNTIVFSQRQTDYWLKSNYEKEDNPYEKFKPVKNILKYKFNQNREKYILENKEGPLYIQRGFTRAYSPVYKEPDDIDHISELRKNDLYYIESGIAYEENRKNTDNDLWLRIILEAEFQNKEALINEGFPEDPKDSMYMEYEENEDGSIFIRYYAYIPGDGLNLTGLINYLGLPVDIF